ncbi:hypothetical protein SBO82_13455 [Alcaligenes nematophilus]|uniref:hypothetical protein n=1 Tax=Alcaligenes nematophilus TaxID=2994643 RepID=UPI002463622B|nr:hypothetical protein [Alcaligenes nematophilus]MDH4867969.1 hypothetical protein [Bacillus cereus]MDY7129281.1 hypothetical protein [Alcaligenes nematophilus]
MSKETQTMVPENAEPVYQLWSDEGFGGWTDTDKATYCWWLDSKNPPRMRKLYTAPVAAQPDVTQQTLDDVMAGIPARDAEIAVLRKEIETLQAAQAQQYVSGGNLADRLDVLADTASPGSQMQSDLYAAATIWRKHLKGPAAQQPVSGADDIEFLVRVLEQVSAWLPEDWSEFLERNPAVVDMLRPMVNHQTQQDADKVDAERWRAYRASVAADDAGFLQRALNAIEAMGLEDGQLPSEDQIDAAIDAARKEPGQ